MLDHKSIADLLEDARESKKVLMLSDNDRLVCEVRTLFGIKHE